jgi:hypothetical protein
LRITLRSAKRRTAVVAGEGAVLEHRVGEQVGGRHRHLHAGAASAFLKRLMCWSRAASSAERDQVVVVERDAVGAEFGEPVHGLDRIDGRAWRRRTGSRPASRRSTDRR